MAKPPDSLRIRKDIEAGAIPSVWLWTGPEEYLKEELFQKAAEAVLAGDASGLNSDRFHTGQQEADVILNTVRTFPMLSDRRLVYWQEIEGLKKNERELLLQYVRDPSPQTVLILTSSRGPRDSFNAQLEEAGAHSAVFWVPFANQTVRWIQLQFKEHGLECSQDVAGQLLSLCSGAPGEQVPLRNIAPEIEKVALAAAGQGMVGPEHLRVVARKPGEDSLRRVTHAVGKRNLTEALRALDQALLFKENAPVRIVATLGIYLKSVAQTQDLMAQGAPEAGMARAVGVWPKEWEGIRRSAQEFPSGQPRRLLSVLSAADRRLKSTGEDDRLLLEETLAALCK